MAAMNLHRLFVLVACAVVSACGKSHPGAADVPQTKTAGSDAGLERSSDPEGPHPVESEAAAIWVAQDEIKKLGYDVGRLDVKVWYRGIPRDESERDDTFYYYLKFIETGDKRAYYMASAAARRIPAILDRKRYWAVYHHPKSHNVGGGDVWVFLHADLGTVLAVWRGK